MSHNRAQLKRHGHHQKRNQHFLKVYTPYLPLLAIPLIAFGIFRNLTTQAVHNGQNNVLAFATNMSPADLLTATNSRRAAANVGALTINSKLASAAQAKANDMAQKNYWAHVSPDGSQPWSFISNAGYSYNKAGENLACGFDTSTNTVTGWYNSPTHKDNMLKSDYTEVGFGIMNAADYNCGDLDKMQQTIIVAMYAQPYTKTSSPQSTSQKTSPTSAKATTTTKPTNVPTTSTVKITVLDENGKPAKGVLVTLHSEPKTAYTDENGVATFTNIEDGDHTARFELNGIKSEQKLSVSAKTNPETAISIQQPKTNTNQTSTTNGSSNSVTSKSSSISKGQILTNGKTPFSFLRSDT